MPRSASGATQMRYPSRATMLVANAHTLSPGCGCAVSMRTVRAEVRAVPRGPCARPEVTRTLAMLSTTRHGTPSGPKTCGSASPSDMLAMDSVGSASKSIAGPARSRPERITVAPSLRLASVRMVSMRPVSCVALSMDSETSSPARTRVLMMSQVVRRAALRKNANVHALPDCSMSRVMTYSSHTSMAVPDVQSRRSTV